MEISEEKGIVRVKLADSLSLEHLFQCGQCFRWKRSEQGGYVDRKSVV